MPASESGYDEHYDVIIVGSGFAGLAAAIEARQAGATVLVLEKMRGRGGNSSISDGFIAAAGSRLQARHGISDSPENMAADMLEAGLGLNHPDLVRVVTERSGAAAAWLEDAFGVVFADRVYQIGGHATPRTLWVKSHAALHTGADAVRRMLSRATALGIEIRTQARLQALLQDDSGRVEGVAALEGAFFPKTEGGRQARLAARRGVVLASGGFANDVPFRRRQDPRLTAEVETTNRRGATAEVLLEALRIGAMPVHLSWIQAGPWATPDEKGANIGANFATVSIFPHGIVVTPRTGRRIVNERSDRRQRADAILACGHPCIGLVDARGAEASRAFLDECLRKGSVARFETLDDLAHRHAVPADGLKATVARFNQALAGGDDPDFKRPVKPGEPPVTQPPFYAMRLWPKIHYTMGGVQIDTRARVIHLDNRPIEGLFAAGEITGGVHGACRLGSCAITDCLVFGRIAGRQAAALKRSVA